MQQVPELLQTGVYQTITPEKSTTVKELLKELKLEGMCFGVLVNGKKATLETKISEKDEVVILPKIAGGFLPDQFFSVTDLFLNGRGLSLRKPVSISFTASGYVVVTGKIAFSSRELKWLEKLSRSGEECFLSVLYENNFYAAFGYAVRYKDIHLKTKIKLLSSVSVVKNESSGFDMFEIDVEFGGKEFNFPNNSEVQRCFECGANILCFYVIKGLLKRGLNLKEVEKVLQSKFVRFLCCSCCERRILKEAKIIA